MSLPQLSVLVVDDEPPLRRVLQTSLSALGYSVQEACSGEQALEMVPQRAFDMILLDINMTGLSGVETCRRIRELLPQVGIVMVTVRDAESDIVRALEAGADDYVKKPFRFRELVARLRAVLRRVHVENAPQLTVLRAGNLELDVDRRVLRRSGEVVHLTPKEFELLAELMKNEGIPVTHKKLLRSIWGPEYGAELDYLRSYIKTLRKKIEDHPARPRYLLTEAWVGYRFCNPSDPDSFSPQDE
jgi:two-component system KDP operon response regulator KdpE